MRQSRMSHLCSQMSYRYSRPKDRESRKTIRTVLNIKLRAVDKVSIFLQLPTTRSVAYSRNHEISMLI